MEKNNYKNKLIFHFSTFERFKEMENQPQSFANIVHEFLLTTLLWSLLDTLPGEWRDVTEAGL